MDRISQIKIKKATVQQRQEMINLLQSEKLPVGDLSLSPDSFLVATDEDKVIGAVGLEQYDNCGLLRSMVVDKKYRNRSIASQLIQQLENQATAAGISYMYLLTETAADYFERKGYQRITREEVPEKLQGSTEFSYVCPAGAIVMKKEIR